MCFQRENTQIIWHLYQHVASLSVQGTIFCHIGNYTFVLR